MVGVARFELTYPPFARKRLSPELDDTPIIYFLNYSYRYYNDTESDMKDSFMMCEEEVILQNVLQDNQLQREGDGLYRNRRRDDVIFYVTSISLSFYLRVERYFCIVGLSRYLLVMTEVMPSTGFETCHSPPVPLHTP